MPGGPVTAAWPLDMKKVGPLQYGSFLQRKSSIITSAIPGLSLARGALNVGVSVARKGLSTVSNRKGLASLAALGFGAYTVYNYGPSKRAVLSWMAAIDDWTAKAKASYDEGSAWQQMESKVHVGMPGTGTALELKHSFTFLSWDASVERGRQGWTFLREKLGRKPKPQTRVAAQSPIHGSVRRTEIITGHHRTVTRAMAAGGDTVTQQAQTGAQFTRLPGGTLQRDRSMGAAPPELGRGLLQNRMLVDLADDEDDPAPASSFMQVQERSGPEIFAFDDTSDAAGTSPQAIQPLRPRQRAQPSPSRPQGVPPPLAPPQYDIQHSKSPQTRIFEIERVAADQENVAEATLLRPPRPQAVSENTQFPFYLAERVGETSNHGLYGQPTPRLQVSNYEQFMDASREFWVDLKETIKGKLTPAPLLREAVRATKVRGDKVTVGKLHCNGQSLSASNLAGMLVARERRDVAMALQELSFAESVLKPGEGAYSGYEEYIAKAYLPLKAQLTSELKVVKEFLLSENALPPEEHEFTHESLFEIPELLCVVYETLEGRGQERRRQLEETQRRRREAAEELGRSYGVDPSLLLRAAPKILALAATIPPSTPTDSPPPTAPPPPPPHSSPLVAPAPSMQRQHVPFAGEAPPDMQVMRHYGSEEMGARQRLAEDAAQLGRMQ